MLSLTVKEGEYIMIGENVRIQFFQNLPAKRMKIAIDAPKSVTIARNRPYEKALSEDYEANAEKLEQVILQNQSQVLALEKAKEKARLKKEQREKEKAESENAPPQI